MKIISLEVVGGFLKKVAQDEDLMNKLARTMEAEDDRAAVTQLAIRKGYEVIPDELRAEVQRRQAESQIKVSCLMKS
ncbi:Nif11-like leader peptide family natural product precursor [Synechococcus sp. Nb3U1]|uniref:Nif11-like leader peptide family natural product precursor n=1 Tax=Synechococcus sp. Nb3U1 TaxID=1914529 RepID=UPI001F357956|nr:Nif11-like leader peptide family natural product precursor [Synechococcus sp. Nb3U1]MCF2969878.1 Nif11-like leader peptide family natural product precursor [Synechococcus sp. Nb3U1]